MNEETKLPIWEFMNAVRAAIEEVEEEHGGDVRTLRLVEEIIEDYIFGGD